MTAVAEKTNLLGMPKAKMEAFFESLGEKRFRATQVLRGNVSPPGTQKRLSLIHI